MQPLSSYVLPLLLFSCLLPFHFLTKAQAQVVVLCHFPTNYTSGSVYQRNLNLVLSSLAASASISGFNMISVGQDPDTVYGLIQCRSDVSKEECQTCATTSAIKISQLCPNQKAAFINYDYCLLRYSFRRFFSFVTRLTTPGQFVNNNMVRNPALFNDQLMNLVNNLSSNAVSNPSRSAAGSTLYNGSAIYGMAQCTRDLAENDCFGCLQEASNRISHCCYGKEGGRIIDMNCNLRYEIYQFFTLSPSPPPPLPPIKVPSSPPPLLGRDSSTYGMNDGKNKTPRTTIVVVIIATIAFIVASTICGCFLWRRRRKTRKISFDSVHEDSNTSMDSLLFDLKTLKAATKNFSDEYKLGQGGFGPVYKGELPDGREIAVKRLSSSSGQGLEELRTEVTLVTKLLHRNLVRLLGFCLEEEEKLLVYEYLPNRSLDKILFDKSKGSSLGWERRYKIIYGIARGLLYLHEDSQLRIIHRDMKASNILLDNHMNPKISDFGLARLFCGSQTHGSTNRIAGTYGYMAPEYAKNGHFSTRSDVYSFGVLVLEIVTRRKGSSFYNSMNLQNLAWQQWAKGTALDLVDPALADQFPKHEVLKCIQIGLLCIQDDAADRPSMSEIVLMLSSHTITTPVPLQPPIFVAGRDFESDETREDSDAAKLDQNNRKAIQLSVNEVTISELSPRS